MDSGQLPKPGQGSRDVRDRPPSVKRVREGEGEGEWRDAAPRRRQRPRAKVVTGTAQPDGFNDLARPEQFWVGNTRSDTDQNKVMQVLEKCASDLGIEDFVIDDVHPLTKEANPRSRSWKVTVPARLKESMLNPAMYPRG